MKDPAATGPGPRHQAASKGQKRIESGEAGRQELAKHVRFEIAHMYKCESVRDFVAKTRFPDRTISRVLNCQPVSMNTILRLERTFRWKPGTGLRYLQGPPADEKPKLKTENERKLWAALTSEETKFLTPRERAAFLDIHRQHSRENQGNEQSG